MIAFKHLPVVVFRRCPNLRDLLVLAKLPSNSTNPNPQLPCGSFRCGKNCATCPYISDGLTSYTFFSTGKSRTIKSNLTCDTKNLIYMIQCNRCNLQYIGETKRRLKDRFNEHRRTIDNPKTKSKPTTAAEHFLSSPNHTANDMQLIPIEKIFSNRDSIRVRPKKLFFNFKRQNTCTSWPQHSRRNILIIWFRSFGFLLLFSFYFTLSLLFFYHCYLSGWSPYVFPLLRKHFTYKTYQCKFYLTVLEEGWFGQPKYSTPSKISPTLYRTLLLYFYFYLLNRLDH